MSLKNAALLLAAAAATACASSAPFILNNAASGVSVGVVEDTPNSKNLVVFATESLVDGVSEIEILRTDNGLVPPAAHSVNAYAVNKKPLSSSRPFKDLACAGGKKTPLLVYPRTQMQIVSDESIRLFFVCLGDEADEFGALYVSTSTNKALSWSEPTLVGFESDGVLLKGLTPVIANLKNQNRWILPVQTSSCSFTFGVLDLNPTTGVPTVNPDTSLTYCVDKGELQVSSAAWVRAPASETKGGDNHRIVLMMLLGNSSDTSSTSLESSALACSMHLTDCSDKFSWADYTPNIFGDKGSTNGFSPLPTGTIPSLMATATYAFRSEKAGDAAAVAACKSQFPQLLLASQTLITTTNGEGANTTDSYLAFASGQTISDLYKPSERTLVGAVVNSRAAKTRQPTAEEIVGVVAVALPPSLVVSESGDTTCVPNWAFFASLHANATSSHLPAYVSGSFTNADFDADAAKRESDDAPKDDEKEKGDGQPALAAAITFCIIGGVCVLLGAVFIVGFLRNRKKYDSVAVEDTDVSKA